MKKTIDNLIIIPGNGATNKEWAEQARDYFADDFKSVSVQYYDHWASGGELIDMEIELKKLTNTAESLSGGIAILAKSIGTALFMLSIHSKSIAAERIGRCVFLGLPPEWARKNGFDIDDWSSDYFVPTTLIQNDHDPVASAEDIRREQAEGKFGSLNLIARKGDDHSYEDFEEVKKYLI